MAESLNHITYVRKIVEYVKDIPTDFISRYLLVDLPDFPERPTPTLDGYIPDVLYKDTNIIIIGEAKTIRDVENDHTERQINMSIYAPPLISMIRPQVRPSGILRATRTVPLFPASSAAAISASGEAVPSWRIRVSVWKSAAEGAASRST